ncbi:MAG: hypothetical protein V1726_06430 [Methanobacteriota archaeon]
MFDTTFDDAISIIKAWQPKQRYPNEPQYRDDLLEFLRNKFDRIAESSFGIRTRLSIKKEDGRGLCDIAIGNAVGIEMKKDLKGKSEVDRLTGQIVSYKKQYGDLIIVLIGKTDGDALENLKEQISSIFRDTSFGMNREPRIKIITKGTKSENTKDKKSGKKQGKKPYDPFNFNIPVFKPPKINIPEFKPPKYKW